MYFSQWDQIFKDKMTTMAAIDRLVHHSIILEFDGQSHRVKKAARSAEKAAADLPASPHRKHRSPPLSPGSILIVAAVIFNCRWTKV